MNEMRSFYLLVPYILLVGLNITEKYDVVQEYLLSLYHLGQLERLVGDTRSAKFHIKEGWSTAHFMALPKWYRFLKQ